LVAILVDAWHPNHQGNEVDAKVRVLLRVIFAGTIKDIVPTGHIIIYTLKKKKRSTSRAEDSEAHRL
jgi:hypothetical protein